MRLIGSHGPVQSRMFDNRYSLGHHNGHRDNHDTIKDLPSAVFADVILLSVIHTTESNVWEHRRYGLRLAVLFLSITGGTRDCRRAASGRIPVRSGLCP
jgi:hypothetical protein